MKKVMMLICLAGMTLLSVQSGNVPLKGELGGDGTMKNPAPKILVEAYQSATHIQLTFLVDLGVLNITVADETGAPVFQTKVNAAAGSGMDIDTCSLQPGVYTLSITDGLGGSLEGYFVIN